MPRYEKDQDINVLNKSFNVGEVVNNLTKVPSNEIHDFFNGINLNFEREVRIKILRSVFLDEALQTRRERASLADEMNYRLSWFNQFSESQLVNLFSFYQDHDLVVNFLDKLWLELLNLVKEKGITDEDLMRLIELGEHHKEAAFQEEDIIKYNNNLDNLFFDHKGYIDGLTPEQLRPVLYKSSTMTEIRGIGKKYGVTVPQRLKKAELLEIIIDELKENDKYTLELEEKLKKMNVILIQRFAFDNDIKASTELKKEEIIEYILKNAEITKESYYIPSDTVYEVEAKDVGHSIEALEEELVVEEPEEEIIEEDIIEEEVEEEVVEEEEIDDELIEEIVEDILEEEFNEEPVVEKVVEKVIYREAPVQVQEKLFDPSTVKRTVLNIHEFHGEKAKFLKNALREEEEFNNDIEEENKKEEDKDFEITLKRVSGFRRFFKFIFGLIIFLVVVALLLAIYAIVTEFTGNLPSLTNIETKIADLIKIDLFQTVRTFVRNLYNSVFNR